MQQFRYFLPLLANSSSTSIVVQVSLQARPKGGGGGGCDCTPPFWGETLFFFFLLACYRGWWCTKIPLPVSCLRRGKKVSEWAPPPPLISFLRTSATFEAGGGPVKIRTPFSKSFLRAWSLHFFFFGGGGLPWLLKFLCVKKKKREISQWKHSSTFTGSVLCVQISKHIFLILPYFKEEKSHLICHWSKPGPPHSVLFRVRVCSFLAPFESTLLSQDCQNFWTPFRGLFAGFSCLGDRPP